MTETIQCPFVYKNGKRCTGHVVRVEAFRADVAWVPDNDGKWKMSVGEPRSHYHVFCSEKGNHAGYGRQDADGMKFYLQDLPEELRTAIG